MLPRAYPHPFPATRRLTLLVVALLTGHIVLAWLVVQAVFVFVEITWRVAGGRTEYRALLATLALQFRMLHGIQLGLQLATAAVFVWWVGRARANLSLLGAAGFRYAPGQAMKSFLSPGACLGRPVAVLGELWNASDPKPPAGASWRAAPTPARVRWWWALVLGAVTVEAVARALALWFGLPLELGVGLATLVLSQLLGAAAAAVSITLVLGVDNRQEAAAWRRAPGEPRG